MIKTILFDMGNVLVDFSPLYIVSNFTNRIDDIELLVKEIFLKQEWLELDNGTTTEEQLIKDVKKRLPKRLHSLLIDIIDRWDYYFTEKNEILSLIKELKTKNYTLILASNAGLRFNRFKKKIKVLKYFDDLIISADIKISKPKPEFFSYILKKHRLKASECLFIDDLTKNVMGANRVGIHGYVFNGNTNLLKKYLKNIKVL